MTAARAASFEAAVNFTRNRVDAGTYSQFDPTLVRLDLAPVPTRVIDIRSMSPAPSIREHGFELVEHATRGDWDGRDWLWGDYAASCRDLVKRVTGASMVLSYHVPLPRSTDRADGGAEAARFIHIDQPRDEYRAQVVEIAEAAGFELRRGAVYNIWKATSPLPRDEMLAVADRRDVHPNDLIRGVNVETAGGFEAPFYGIVVPDAPMPLYSAPDMSIDESLIFLAADFDPDRPLGCAHTSVVIPTGDSPPVPRRSVEARIIALFE